MNQEMWNPSLLLQLHSLDQPEGLLSISDRAFQSDVQLLRLTHVTQLANLSARYSSSSDCPSHRQWILYARKIRIHSCHWHRLTMSCEKFRPLTFLCVALAADLFESGRSTEQLM